MGLNQRAQKCYTHTILVGATIKAIWEGLQCLDRFGQKEKRKIFVSTSSFQPLHFNLLNFRHHFDLLNFLRHFHSNCKASNCPLRGHWLLQRQSLTRSNSLGRSDGRDRMQSWKCPQQDHTPCIRAWFAGRRRNRITKFARYPYLHMQLEPNRNRLKHVCVCIYWSMGIFPYVQGIEL